MLAEQIAIVGKNGVGKSTTAVNLSAALAEAGHRVALIRYCSHWDAAPDRDGREPVPVPGWSGGAPPPCYSHGFRGMLTIEAADGSSPDMAPGSARIGSCALIEAYAPHFIVHDVAWRYAADMVLPAVGPSGMRLFMVTTADIAAVSAANSYFGRLREVHQDTVSFSGLIINNVPGPLHESMVADYARKARAALVATIPHSLFISVSNYYNRPLVDSAPFSHNSFIYRKVARLVSGRVTSPRPGVLDREQLREWAGKWSEITTELETGEVRDGAGI